MLLALRAVRRSAGHLRRPLCLLQWKGQSDVGFQRASSDLERLLVVKDKQVLADQIQLNSSACAFVDKMESIGSTSFMLHACRQVLGNRLEKTGMDHPVETAENANELHKNQTMSSARFFREFHYVIIKLQNLNKEIQEEIQVSESSMIGSIITRIRDDGKEEALRCQWYQDEVRDLLELDFPDAEMPSAEAIEKTKKHAEELFKQRIAATLPHHEKQKVQEADLALQVEKDCQMKKADEVKKIKARLYEAEATINGLIKKEENYEEGKEIVHAKLQKKQAELEASEKRDREFTYNMWGIFTPMWKNDVALARQEKEMKRKEIKPCEEELWKMNDDAADLAATKATAEAKLKEIKDELTDAEEEEAEAKNRVEERTTNLNNIWLQIAEQCQENGFLDLEEAERVKVMSAMIQMVTEEGRQLEKFASDGRVLKKARTKINRLLKAVEQATGLKQIQQALESFLKGFTECTDGLLPEADPLAASLHVSRNLNLQEVVKLLNGQRSHKAVSARLQDYQQTQQTISPKEIVK